MGDKEKDKYNDTGCLKKELTFTTLSIRRYCCQLGRNTYDICGKSANAQFGKAQFFLRHPVVSIGGEGKGALKTYKCCQGYERNHETGTAIF